MQKHIPVMLEETLSFFQVKPGCKYIDATVGGGGHSEAILLRGGEVLGIDQDPTSLENARKRLSACPGVFKLSLGNFADLQKIASENEFSRVDGIIFDLGFASFQIDDPLRGLSINHPGPLDMRLSPSLGVTAADLLNSLPENQLFELLISVGEHRGRAIARSIVARRNLEPLKNTEELKNLIEQVYGDKRRLGKIHPATKTFNARASKVRIHPATRTFMALRMAVNLEIDNLTKALPQALDLLGKDGRIVVISFHSGEDRIVKNFFKTKEEQEELRILTKKPLFPTVEEIVRNPRARSAKLRSGQKNEKLTIQSKPERQE